MLPSSFTSPLRYGTCVLTQVQVISQMSHGSNVNLCSCTFHRETSSDDDCRRNHLENVQKTVQQTCQLYLKDVGVTLPTEQNRISKLGEKNSC